MYQTNLYDLAKRILMLEANGISKVRFAKTIYFVHKALISKGILGVSDITYIRMPLGPVPSGFMELSTEYPDILTIKVPSGLSYNSVEYSVDSKQKRAALLRDAINVEVDSVLGGLRNVSTSELVEISHQDPSWIARVNGDEFEISIDDLKNEVPRQKSAMRLKSEDQLMQASLVKGMLEDIVSESTDLEYPVDGK